MLTQRDYIHNTPETEIVTFLIYCYFLKRLDEGTIFKPLLKLSLCYFKSRKENTVNTLSGKLLISCTPRPMTGHYYEITPNIILFGSCVLVIL